MMVNFTQCYFCKGKLAFFSDVLGYGNKISCEDHDLSIFNQYFECKSTNKRFLTDISLKIHWLQDANIIKTFENQL